MPQEMNVLCCYSCKMYQVHIVKKARKWQCKLCNEKQSVRQIYFQGSGKDCRLYVQRLNYLKVNEMPLASETTEVNEMPLASVVSEQDDSRNNYDTSASVSQKLDSDKVVESKWMKYLNSPKEGLYDVEDSSFKNIRKTEDTMSNEKFSNECNDIKNDSPNFEDILDDIDLETKYDTDDYETKKSYSINSNSDKCNLQNNNTFSKDHDDTTNIFETYGELDEPLDF